MRLPITPQISTKDGISNKNARLTNCLKESKKGGDKAVVRPGLVLDAQASGVGNGLVVFNNELVSVYGATLGFGVDESDPLNLMFLKLNGTITDEFGHTTAAAATGSFSSAQMVCGSESYIITSASDHIIVTPKTPNVLAVGATDFTVEGWIYYVSGSATLFRYTDGGDYLLEIIITPIPLNPEQINLSYTDDTNDIGVSSSQSIVGVWTHLAAVSEYSGDLTFYVNGTSVGAVPAAAIDLFDAPTIQVGGGNAYFSNVRFYNGMAYTGNFSPSCYVAVNSIPALATITGDRYDFAQSPL